MPHKNLEYRRKYAIYYREINGVFLREYNKNRAADRRAMVDDMKVAAGCADCGYNENPVALDFDHVRGEKIGAIGNLVRGRLDKLMAEIKKCEVVCSNCHRIRTQERR